MDESTKDRIVAIVRLTVMLIATAAGCFGLAVDADALLTFAALAVGLVAGVVSWWKNSNMTKAAQQAQNYLDAIKKGTEDGDDE